MRALLLASVVASVLVSHVAAADDLMPRTEPASLQADDDYTNVRTTLGAVVFGGAYGASVISAAASDHPGAGKLYIPVAGPWLALNEWGNDSGAEKLLLVADGIVQAGGLVALLDGVLAPNRGRVTTVADKSLHVTPSHNGVMVWAHF